MTERTSARHRGDRRAGAATGKQLVGASWRMLRQDKQLIWLPFVGALVSAVAAGILFAAGYALGWLISGQDEGELAFVVGLVLGSFAGILVGIFFQAALVIGANERAEGRDPTRSTILSTAWGRRGRILSWAALTTTVGLLVRVIMDRLGSIGAIIGALGGLAWAVATFLVVPVLIAEDVGPVKAVRRSASLLRDTWGPSLRSYVRFGAIAILIWLPAVVVTGLGVYLVMGGGTDREVIGAVLLGLGVLALIVLNTVFSAVTAYVKAVIYRYATGQATPGIDDALIAGAFRSSGNRL
ncbi:MAG: DUF6159 family protein [Nocardioidaceae bacterium]